MKIKYLLIVSLLACSSATALTNSFTLEEEKECGKISDFACNGKEQHLIADQSCVDALKAIGVNVNVGSDVITVVKNATKFPVIIPTPRCTLYTTSMENNGKKPVKKECWAGGKQEDLYANILKACKAQIKKS